LNTFIDVTYIIISGVSIQKLTRGIVDEKGQGRERAGRNGSNAAIHQRHYQFNSFPEIQGNKQTQFDQESIVDNLPEVLSINSFLVLQVQNKLNPAASINSKL